MPMAFEIGQTLDCKGLCCPLPILRTKKTLDGMAVGQILEMVGTDPASKPDMVAFTRRTGHELLESKEQDGLFVFYIRKTK